MATIIDKNINDVNAVLDSGKMGTSVDISQSKTKTDKLAHLMGAGLSSRERQKYQGNIMESSKRELEHSCEIYKNYIQATGQDEIQAYKDMLRRSIRSMKAMRKPMKK